MHSMRSCFKRWLELHDENSKIHNYVRIPHWFRWYIRNNCRYVYVDKCTNVIKEGRRYGGKYCINIMDSELLLLERPPMIREVK